MYTPCYSTVPVHVTAEDPICSISDPVGSQPFWSDPDPDLNKPFMWKTHKCFRNFYCITFCFMNIYFLENYFRKKNPEETWLKIYLGQDPDLNVLKSRIHIR
jgi:hypothetical protein